jgi:hypothetical protein
MTLPDPAITPEEIAYWRGRVDASLLSLDVRMKNIEAIVDLLPDRIEMKMEKIINNKESNRLTFQWVLEKIALPFLLGGGSAGLAIYVIKTIGG